MEIDFTEIEQKVKEITKICESIPETYRLRCFEYLMENFLIIQNVSKPEQIIPESKKLTEQIPIPIDVRAFLTQYELEPSVIEKLFLMDGVEIRHTYKIRTTKKSQAQIQISLLMALENTIRDPNKKFEFAATEVRQRCIDLQCYDMPNFSTHFKNNKSYFKSLDDLEHIVLSSDGKSELAEVILQMINGKG